ncbi:4840_t:CDS:2 [Acaulospora morrowiae]|uniref:4840_t:CDS:1 n=1 Tax=Acaulospora morrowiae TaxID=94023 RepID=A0A9N8YVR4_9GLOM|nr:4840_t:CDS:2 [Acaulospora morrowiae]
MEAQCKCVECTTSHIMDNDYKRDLQNLILRMCRMIFRALQEGTNTANLRTIKQKMYHGDVNSKYDLDQFIGIFKSAKYLPYIAGVHHDPISTVTFDFNWEIKEHKENMDSIILISKDWYKPFLEYVGKMDRWRQHYWRDVTESSPHAEELLRSIKDRLPGFKYLYDFHWNVTTTFEQQQEPSVLLLASECGVFAIVVIKFWNQDNHHSDEPEIYNEWVRAYKLYAAEKHGNKCLMVIGATYTNDPDVMEPLEFVDEIDYSIALSVQSFATTAPHFTSHSNVKRIIPWTSKPTENVLQAAQAHFRRMPINPGKCPAVVGTEWIYYGGKTDSECDEYDLNDDYKCYYDNRNFY